MRAYELELVRKIELWVPGRLETETDGVSDSLNPHAVPSSARTPRWLGRAFRQKDKEALPIMSKKAGPRPGSRARSDEVNP